MNSLIKKDLYGRYIRQVSKVAGYRARAGRIGLAVDNFSVEKIANDFNAQSA